MTYTVVNGDTLWDIAKRFDTSVDIIVADNSFISDPNALQVGWELVIRTPEEVAAEKADQAMSDQIDGQEEADSAVDEEPPLISDGAPATLWDGAEITEGQTGRVRILRTFPLLERSVNDVFRVLRDLQPEERYRTFDIITGDWFANVDGVSTQITTMYNVGGNQWVGDVDGYVEFETVPSDLLSKKGKVTILSVADKAVERVAPTTPYFESRNHPRPVLQLQKEGKIVTMEMRILNSSSSRSTMIQQNRTNSGFFINIAGANLPVFAVQGIFLDTKTNQEFDDFIDRYDQYVEAFRDGDFYSSPIATLFYKSREYRGLIAAFDYHDDTSQQLLRSFSLQLLVLREKGRGGAAAAPTVISKAKVVGDDFYSDLRYLLINPITGLYGTE